MFAPIYSNLQSSVIATKAAKSTFYRWLGGATPELKILTILHYKMGIKLDIPYIDKFISTAKLLSNTNEPQKIPEILELSGLVKDDKVLLGDYHKKRIWQKNNVLTKEYSYDD